MSYSHVDSSTDLHPDATEAAKSLAGPKLSKNLGLDEKLVLLEQAEEKYYERNKQVR